MKRLQKASLDLLNTMVAGLVKRGSVTLVDAEGGRYVHGDGGEPHAVMRLHDAETYARLFLDPELAVGEAYMDGRLTFDDGSIRDLLTIFHINAQNLRQKPLRRVVAELAKKARRIQQHNPITTSRRNVAHHYDISNDFYRLFLDKGLNYSCGYFEKPGLSLESAQKAKLRHIAAKMMVQPGMRVLDIGCGWGSMAIYLARRLGADVLGVTLSTEQLALAKQRVKDCGLEGRVEFRLQDYREITGQFDRVVSIGMFEHVGVAQYKRYFAQLSALLNEDGLALLHSIGTKNGPGVTGPWIRKYIFPGGYSPALSEVLAVVESEGLWVTDIEIWRSHYAETLRCWAERFQANRAAVQAMFDERFCRMWEFYLGTAEFAFRHGGHMVFQLQLAKKTQAAPVVRNYMRKAEKRLARLDDEKS